MRPILRAEFPTFFSRVQQGYKGTDVLQHFRFYILIQTIFLPCYASYLNL